MANLPSVVSRKRVTEPLSLHGGWNERWLNFVDVTFTKRVDFSGLQARGIGFYRCRFDEGVDLSGVQVDNDLVIYKSIFRASLGHTTAPGAGTALRLDGAKIGGDLRVLASQAEVITAAPYLAASGVLAENLRVTGDVDFRGLRVYDVKGKPWTAELLNLANKEALGFGAQYPHLFLAFRLAGSHVEGSLRLGALYEEREKAIPLAPHFPQVSFFGGPVELANSRISGDIDLTGSVMTSDLSLRNSQVGGHVYATGQVVADSAVRLVVGGGFDLYGVQLGGSLDLSSAYVAKGVHLIFAKIAGGLFARLRKNLPPMELGSKDESEISLNLTASVCGTVECDSVKMDGLLLATTGEFGRLYLSPSAPNPDADAIELSPCEALGISLRSVTIKDNAVFRGIRLLGKSLYEQDAAGAFQMISCSVGRNLVLGSHGLFRSYLDNQSTQQKLRYLFGVSATGASPRAQVSARDPAATNERKDWEEDAQYCSSLGRLDLSGSIIQGDMDLSCLAVRGKITLDHARAGGDLYVSRKSIWYGEPKLVRHPQFRTTCTRLSAQYFRCEGDADLTGLTVTGDVTARHLVVRGDLFLVDADSASACADITGSVELQGASASRLVLSGENFRQGRTGSLDLSDTEFQKITIRASNKLPANASRAALFKLYHCRVKRWEITNWDGRQEVQEHDARGFLRQTTPELGGAYNSVETHLREEGRFGEANDVFRRTARYAWVSSFKDPLRAVDREWRQRKTWGKRVSYAVNPMGLASQLIKSGFAFVFWLLSAFVGYGTNPWPSMVAIVAAFVVSTVYFANPFHVDVAETFRAYMNTESAHFAELHPGDRAGCALVCGGRPACAQLCSTWKLPNAASVAIRYTIPLLKLTGEDLWKPSLNAVHFASGMALLNWILWPVFLATVTKYILRRL